jgi:hypothetical protein
MRFKFLPSLKEHRSNIARKSIEKRLLQGLGLVLILWSFTTGLRLTPYWKEVLLRSDSMVSPTTHSK